MQSSAPYTNGMENTYSNIESMTENNSFYCHMITCIYSASEIAGLPVLIPFLDQMCE